MDREQLLAETDDTEPTLFEVELDVMVKDFVSQKQGTSKSSFEVKCNSLEDFCQCVWTIIEPYIQKEIVCNEDSQRYEWANYETTAENLEKFVVFQDKISKRTYETLHLSTKLLHAWRNKKGLICFVHVYGNILKKKQHYEQAYRQVIQPDDTDRAGAVTNTEVFKCMEELKDLHSDLVATEASWLRWANWIKKQPGHARETLMQNDPPANKPNLLELFKLARKESDRIQEIRSGISIGKRVNASIECSLPHIQNEVEDLIEIFKSGLCKAERIKALLEAMKSQLANNDNLMDGFNEALGTHEDEFSTDLLNDIENIDDIDHQQDDVED